jgi:hypothetical protein
MGCSGLRALIFAYLAGRTRNEIEAPPRWDHLIAEADQAG